MVFGVVQFRVKLWLLVQVKIYIKDRISEFLTYLEVEGCVLYYIPPMIVAGVVVDFDD